MKTEIKYSWIIIGEYLFFTSVILSCWVKLLTHQMTWHGWWELLIFIFVTFILFYKCTRVGILGLLGKPAITLTSNEIELTDYCYKIKWKDISNVELEESHGKGGPHYTLYITIRNQQHYINQLKDPLVRICYQFMYNNGQPITIELSSLKGDPLENYNLIENDYLLKRR